MTVFEWDGWVFDPAEWRLANAAGDAVTLPNKTLDLLALLLDRAPGLVSKEEILSTVWRGAVVEEGNIAFHIAMLRKALGQATEASCIETVRGRGYRFAAPVRRRDRAVEPPASASQQSAPPIPAPARRWRPAHVLPVVVLAALAGVMGWLSLAAPPALTREAPPPVTAAPNAEAVALTERARESWRLRTPPSVQQAITLYQRAIALDPSFAPAYAGLADCYNLTMSGLPVPLRAANAKANAERALALDPGLAAAHTSLAFYQYKFEWKWAEAESEFRRAIAADPSYALAHHWYGEMIGYLGRFDEAIAELRRALALDTGSLPIMSDLAAVLLRAGRVAEARDVLAAGAAINPMYHGIPLRMAEVLAAEGRERESLEEAWRAAVLTGATMESIGELREAYRTGGLPAVLRVEIARLEGDQPGRFAVPAQATFLAGRYARLRDREKTLHWIGVAIDRREDIVLHLPTYPEYDWLRDDPAFDRILARAGLKPLPR